jgi:hypothetical protein
MLPRHRELCCSFPKRHTCMAARPGLLDVGSRSRATQLLPKHAGAAAGASNQGLHGALTPPWCPGAHAWPGMRWICERALRASFAATRLRMDVAALRTRVAIRCSHAALLHQPRHNVALQKTWSPVGPYRERALAQHQRCGLALRAVRRGGSMSAAGQCTLIVIPGSHFCEKARHGCLLAATAADAHALCTAAAR